METGSGSRAGGERVYGGEVVYLYAFDIAYDMKHEPIERLLGCPVREYSIGASKRSPKYMFFHRCQMVELPSVVRLGPRGPVEVKRTAKLFSMGAISIQVRVPFAAEGLGDLVGYHNLKFDKVSLEAEANELAEQLRRQLEPYCVRPAGQLSLDEAYTVFCIGQAGDATQGFRAEDWLKGHRREVAALLAEEPDAGRLSEQEAAESTGQYLSYYDDDLVVADWDAALVVGEKDSVGDILHIMELANVQLVELAAYDRILDASLERAYRDVAARRGRARRKVHLGLREIRVDLARLSDELQNITKFFGDWHLANIYRQLSARFHLADWQKTVDDKTRTLGDLYQLLEQERMNLWMFLLEAAIVVLFVVDVVLLLVGW